MRFAQQTRQSKRAAGAGAHERVESAGEVVHQFNLRHFRHLRHHCQTIGKDRNRELNVPNTPECVGIAQVLWSYGFWPGGCSEAPSAA